MRKAKILREATQVGELNFTTGELTSEDAVLNELWTHWQLEGFDVLGPGSEEPPPGVLAGAVYNVKPAPGEMGLVVIELERYGYRLQFEKTPPAASRPNPVFGRPADRSLTAFKEFISDMTAALGGENDASEEELRAGWRRFWGADDPDAGTGEAHKEDA